MKVNKIDFLLNCQMNKCTIRVPIIFFLSRKLIKSSDMLLATYITGHSPSCRVVGCAINLKDMNKYF